jgi:hypothetical protein
VGVSVATGGGGVSVGVFVGVLVGVFVGVLVGRGPVGVLVGVLVGVEVGVPAQAVRRATSSTYMEVSSPKPSWWTKNSMRIVCPAYGAILKVTFCHPPVVEQLCMRVVRIVPEVLVT